MNELNSKDSGLQQPVSELEQVEIEKRTVVKADVENGFTQLANEYLDGLCKLRLSGRQYQVLMTVVRKTYGYRKKTDWLTSTQIAAIMEYESDPSNLRKDIASLKARRLLVEDGKKIGPNPYVSDWALSLEGGINPSQGEPANVSKLTRKGVKSNPPNGSGSTHTKGKKNNSMKDNYENMEDDYIFVPPDWLNLELFNNWVDMRRLKNKPLIGYAKTLAVEELEKLVEEGQEQDLVIKRAILKSWESFYPVDQGLKPNAKSGNQSQSGAESWLEKKNQERGEQ